MNPMYAREWKELDRQLKENTKYISDETGRDWLFVDHGAILEWMLDEKNRGEWLNY